jgi:hypothetical protein
MPTPNFDPNKRMIKVRMDLSRPEVITPEKLPPDPESERIAKAAQLRLLREAGYLPLK